ncbi:MAG: hypothetical protein ABSA52_15995 [Candidatus Binatia bacterium]|jgi:hypothetical protein
MPTSPAITSLAILKVNWDILHKDYIENFVPIVVECVINAPDDVVSLPHLQEALRSQFGLELPLNPLRQILQRATKQGYLKRQSGILSRNAARCATLNFADVQQRVTRIYDTVAGRLVEFAATNHATQWSVEQAEAALLEFIAERGLAFLYAEAERSPLVLGPAPAGSAFILGSFLSEMRRVDHQLLEDVEVLIKGNMLANSLFLPEHGRLSQRFHKTRVYLDSSIIVSAAGYAGKDRQAPCTELLNLLRDYGADLCCFKITFEEVRGILDACTIRLRQGQLDEAYGPSIEYFIQEGMSASDVELMAARLPQKIAGLGIRVDPKPSYEYRFQIDEAAFEARLQDEIGYQSGRARIHDLDCISAIARLRRGHDSYFIETCDAIFVTPNTALARATRRFFQVDSPPGAIALCITDYALGNLLWLKNPTKAPDLPRKRLIADAYAAMQPPEALWKKYLLEIAHLEQSGRVSSDDYYLLRHSTAAKAALMEITQGYASAFTEGTIAEVLAVARENLRADLRRSLEDAKEKRREAEERAEQLEAGRAQVVSRVEAFSNSLAWWLCRSLRVLAISTLGIATLYSFPWGFPDLRSSWLWYALSGAQGLLFIFFLANMIWGTTLEGVATRFQAWLAERVERTARHLLRLEHYTGTQDLQYNQPDENQNADRAPPVPSKDGAGHSGAHAP